ncbi:MAG: hypothetical protein AMXMBFR48_20080 [Ignavibacteriales bacterium]
MVFFNGIHQKTGFRAEILLFILVSFCWSSCDAPRSNPLDPENPANRIYRLKGTVLSAEKNPRPLGGVSVFWQNENLSTRSADDGSFTLQCEKRTPGWLVFTLEGYSADSIMINWSSEKSVTVSPRLNALPELSGLNIYSTVRNKYSNTEFLLFFEVTLTDADDDIDSVKIICAPLGVEVALTKQTASYFEGRFYDYELELTEFNDVIGKQFQVVAVTQSGNTFQVGSSTVLRVIRDEIEVLTPKNSDTLTTQTPMLTWNRFTPGFSFTYTIEIYTDETEPVLRWRKENVSADEIFMQVETPLTVTQNNDRFFWVIWCIDEYKNKSRSKPAGFTIRP